MTNKGVDFVGTVCVLLCGRQDGHHALVAFAVQIMCYYACALLGAISAQVALFLLLPLGRSLQFCSPEQPWSLSAITLSGDGCPGWAIVW